MVQNNIFLRFKIHKNHLVHVIFYQMNYVASRELSGITRISFFAEGFLHHLPRRCSCPMPAIKSFPSEENANALMKPQAGTVRMGVSERKFSPHFHKRINPSCDPACVKYLACKKTQKEIGNFKFLTWCHKISISESCHRRNPICLVVFATGAMRCGYTA